MRRRGGQGDRDRAHRARGSRHGGQSVHAPLGRDRVVVVRHRERRARRICRAADEIRPSRDPPAHSTLARRPRSPLDGGDARSQRRACQGCRRAARIRRGRRTAHHRRPRARSVAERICWAAPRTGPRSRRRTRPRSSRCPRRPACSSSTVTAPARSRSPARRCPCSAAPTRRSPPSSTSAPAGSCCSPIPRRSRTTCSRHADDAAFGLAIAGAPSRPVSFEEAVHGYGEARGLAALPTRWKWALGGLLLAALVAVAARFRRLGPPEPTPVPPQPPRRAHVDALGSALARTGRPAEAAGPVQAQARTLVLTRARLTPRRRPRHRSAPPASGSGSARTKPVRSPRPALRDGGCDRRRPRAGQALREVR